MIRKRPLRRINHISTAKLVAALLHEPHSVHDIVALTGLCRNTARRYLKAMHAEGA